MNGRVAVIVAHPAHLLTITGLLLRWRPQVLALYREGAGHGPVVRATLDALELGDRYTNFAVSEPQSFGCALAGDFGFHAALGARVADWVRAVRPDAVLGDAYEASNFHHDVGRVLIDAAVRGTGVANFEFPLSCRGAEPGEPLRYGTFPFGPFRALQLTAEEAHLKRRLVDTVCRASAFVANVAPQFASPDAECYRPVPDDRDYTAPPPGLALYYDERGREVVSAGLHARAVTFGDHFVPLVRALGASAARPVAHPRAAG